MMRILIRVSLFLLAAMPALAQDAPKADVFGGYSYSRFNPGTPAGGSGTGANLNGWNASITGNFNNWLGVTADFSGHYGSPSISGINVDTRTHYFLFGPRVSFRKHERVTPFGHALFGAAKLKGSAALLTDRQTAFAMAFGGGVDVKVSDRAAIRLFQADYVVTRFKEASIACIANPLLPPCPLPDTATQHNARLSFGVVLHLGKK
jgi:opacity protein-like surface antigen